MKTINRNLISGLAPGSLVAPTATPAVHAVKPLPVKLPDEAKRQTKWIACGQGTLQLPPTGRSITTEVVELKGFGRIFEVYHYGDDPQKTQRVIESAPLLLAALEKSETAMAALLSAAVLTPRAVVNHPPFKAGIDLTDDALYDCRAALAAAKGQP